MKINKNKDANKSQEYLDIKNKVKKILHNIGTIEQVANELMYLIADEIRKDRVKNEVQK